MQFAEGGPFLKILVISDSHGNTNSILDAVAKESPEMILHLGDYDRDCSVIGWDYQKIPVRCVRGNCDRGSPGPDTDEFTLGGKRYLMTHGNLYSVKTGLSSVISFAVSRGADVLLFGHTHTPHYSVKHGITIINPGSIGMSGKTYAVLEDKDGGLICDIKTLSVK